MMLFFRLHTIETDNFLFLCLYLSLISQFIAGLDAVAAYVIIIVMDVYTIFFLH